MTVGGDELIRRAWCSEVDNFTSHHPSARPASVFAVSITPFDVSGRVDETAFRAHLQRMVTAGVGVYVGGGGSGEGFVLTTAERRRILEIAADELSGKVPFRSMGVETRSASEMIEYLEVARVGRRRRRADLLTRSRPRPSPHAGRGRGVPGRRALDHLAAGRALDSSVGRLPPVGRVDRCTSSTGSTTSSASTAATETLPTSPESSTRSAIGSRCTWAVRCRR